MHIRSLFLAAACGAALTAAADAQVLPATGSGAGTQYGIAEQNNSGETGTVTLFGQGAKTRVVLAMHGMPPGRVQPVHIHRAPATCDNLDPKVAYPLANLVNGHSTTVVNAPLSRLTSGNYAVNVHSSLTNIKHYVACGHLDSPQ